MSISMATKQWIADIAERIPEGKRGEFFSRVKSRLACMDEAPVIGPIIMGALCGAVVEVIPGLETLTGIDDGVEAGAAIGAAYGFFRKNDNDPVKLAILEELQHVLAQ